MCVCVCVWCVFVFMHVHVCDSGQVGSVGGEGGGPYRLGWLSMFIHAGHSRS